MDDIAQLEADKNLLTYLDDIQSWNNIFGPFQRFEPKLLPADTNPSLIWTEYSRTECYIADEYVPIQSDKDITAYFVASKSHTNSGEYLKHMIFYESCFSCDYKTQKTCQNCEGNGNVAVYLYDCLRAKTAYEVRDLGSKFWRKNAQVPNSNESCKATYLKYQDAKDQYDKWIEKYGPIVFESDIDNFESLSKKYPLRVWSEIIEDEGQYFVNGFIESDEVNTHIITAQDFNEKIGLLRVPTICGIPCIGCAEEDYEGCDICDGIGYSQEIDLIS